IHEGVLPGYPASHGCIRTSHDFAQRLWPITKLGVRFVVARTEVVPVAFEHSKLFTPMQKPKEPQIAMNTTNGSGGQPVKLAQAEPGAAERAVDGGVDDVSPAVSVPQVGSAKAVGVAPGVESPGALPAADLRKSVETPLAGEKATEVPAPAAA